MPELTAGEREGVEGVEVEVGGEDSDDAVGKRDELVSGLGGVGVPAGWQWTHPMAYG